MGRDSAINAEELLLACDVTRSEVSRLFTLVLPLYQPGFELERRNTQAFRVQVLSVAFKT